MEYDLSLRFLENALAINSKYHSSKSLKVALRYGASVWGHGLTVLCGGVTLRVEKSACKSTLVTSGVGPHRGLSSSVPAQLRTSLRSFTSSLPHCGSGR